MYWLQPNKLAVLAGVVLLMASLSVAGTPTKEHSATSHGKSHKTTRPGKKASKRRVRGQQVIDGERARQIQEALVREHYLEGQPSGIWDTTTEDALRRYQSNHGWQSKTVPDSRALIRLGLGPGHEHLLNPESAMTSEPQLASRNPAGHNGASPGGAASTATDQVPAPDRLPVATPSR